MQYLVSACNLCKTLKAICPWSWINRYGEGEEYLHCWYQACISATIIDTATFEISVLNSFVRSTLNSSSDNQID